MIEIGMVFNQRYRILGSIGSGGMANVFLAHDLFLDRDVALKMLRSDFQKDPIAVKRFQREALSATELVHPNVVQVYDVGEDNDTQYLAMEYVHGMDLKKYLKKYAPLSPTEAVRIAKQILAGLQEAHSHRIIHRDLKPQNILMDDQGNAKIADFGIAIVLNETSITQTNSMLGSVHYLSPEQARGSMATNRSDLYAIGIILFEMLAGAVPFDGESAVTIALKHFQDPLPEIRKLNPQVPQSLANAILIATAKDPEDRYHSAKEMWNDLSTVLSPARINEPKIDLHRHENLGETKRIVPLTKEQINKKIAPKISKSYPLKNNLADRIVDLYQNKFSPKQIASKLGISLAEVKKRLRRADHDRKIKYPKFKHKKLVAGVLMALLMAMSVVAISANSTKVVRVPALTDLTEAQAKRKLQDLNLEVGEVFQIENDHIEKSRIVKTDPPEKTAVKERRKIDLYLSTGTEKINLEDYVGKDFDEVKEDLKSKGYQADLIIKKGKSSEDYPEGKVIDQSIPAGKKVDPRKDQIEFTVSTGSNYIILENYVGSTLNNVQEKLLNLGLEKSQIVVNYVEGTGKNKGIIVDFDPGQGASLNKSAGKVHLDVSDGTTKVPLNLLGLVADEAKQNLEEAGLSASIVEEESEKSPGTVIAVKNAGGIVQLGTSVEITVAKKKEQKETKGKSSSSTTSSTTSSTDQNFSTNETTSSTSTNDNNSVATSESQLKDKKE